MSLVNVILLYGRQVCAHLDSLVSHWSTVIADHQWADHLFVLLDQETPTLPEKLANIVAPNVRYLNSTEKVDASPINMDIMKRMKPDGVRLMCLCEADSDTAVPAEVLIDLIEQIRSHFVVASVTYQLYLLLSGSKETRARQTAVCKQMMDTKPNVSYFMATVDAHLTLLPFEKVLHAAHSEMLSNAQGRRKTADGLYSIGTASLNADGRELKLLLENEALEQVTARAHENMSNETAMELLTGHSGMWSDSESVMQTYLSSWLKPMFAKSRSLRLPNEIECKTFRVFANVYIRDEASVKQAVKTFFELNTGDDKLMYEDAKAIAEELERDARKRLSSQLNITHFPIFVLDLMSNALEQLSNKPLDRIALKLPQQNLWAKINKKAYIDQCCDEFERACTEEVRERYVRQLARALREQLKKTKEFMAHTDGLMQTLTQKAPRAATLSQLRDKYPRYTAALKNAQQTAIRRIQELLKGNQQLLLSSTGEVRTDDVNLVCQRVENMVEDNLTRAYRGSFWDALAEECSAEGKLQQFFDQYLTAGTRLFHSLHEQPAPPQSLYLTDTAFADTPWGLSHQNEALLAKTDNVERMDLYPLKRSFEEFLSEENSFYFDEEEAKKNNAGGFATMNVRKAQPMPEQRSLPSKESEEDREDVRHGLEVRHTSDDRYLLTWDWKGGENASRVHIVGEDVNVWFPVTSGEFFTSGGVDITKHLLRPGTLEVKVSHGGALYAHGVVAGRQNCVSWRAARDNRGNAVLVLEGKTADINKVVVRGGNIFYPLYANQSPMEFKGFSGNFIPQINPRDLYPSVYLKNNNH